MTEYGRQVYDKKQHFIFQFDEAIKYDNERAILLKRVKELRREVLFSLNSINHEPIDGLKLSINPKDPTEIFNNGELFITIRGWGNLTGSYNFSDDSAKEIQDGFRDWIIHKLTKI